MNPSTPSDAEKVSSTTPVTQEVPPVHDAHTDPISGEANAHPLGVGVGAASAGAAGAVIGAILGPVGAVIGAAIGAVAGGLAGKEIATAEEEGPIADELSLSTPEDEPLIMEPGVPVRPGAYAGDQEQLAVPPYDRLSKDVGYKDAHTAEPLGAAAVPRDIVPEPYQPAEPGDAEYKTPGRSGEVPEAAVAIPPVPTAGQSPYSISDVPLAAAEPAAAHASSDATSITSPAPVSEETIREFAYFRYIDRVHNGGGGDEISDWVEAEKQLRG